MEPERVASDIVALTALPARWAGAPAEKIAQDVAASLYHLCDSAQSVQVTLRLGHVSPIEVTVPPGAKAFSPARADERRSHASPRAIAPVGSMGRYGEIQLVGQDGATLERERLLCIIAANQVEAACRALDLERVVAAAHEKVADLGKLGALGQLVGGVAHEIRTPLTYASNNLYSLASALAAEHGKEVALTAQPHLREIESALDRINAIVRQLRRFAKSEAAPRIEEDMRDLVRDAVRLWRVTHVGSMEVREYLRPTPPILVDRGQIQQVVLNLVQNAAEAATAGKGSTLSIACASEGEDALLVVEDDGPGISPDVMANLFEPFRTTKREGLGLGLSIVRGIIEAHRGTIRIDSAPGRGTRVEVRIPRAPPARPQA